LAACTTGPGQHRALHDLIRLAAVRQLVDVQRKSTTSAKSTTRVAQAGGA
jgi:hypothetical protein